MDRAFKKNKKVKFIIPGIPFIDTKTDLIRWNYGEIVSSGSSKYGAKFVYIRENQTKEVIKVSTFGVFILN
jgi:hypothetical protein